MKKIIVAGYICLDIAPKYKGAKIDKIEEVLKPGKNIGMSGVDIHTGGVVSNTGLALEVLGSDTILVGKVGDDRFGKLIINILREYGVDERIIVEKGETTSYSTILDFPGFDRFILHDAGANNTFCSSDLTDELLLQGSHFHFGYPPLMKRMYKGSGAHLAVMLKRVKKMGLTTSVDMAAIEPDSEASELNWNRILSNVLPFVDFFVPSFEELCFMLDPKKFEMREIQANRDNVDLTRIISIEDDVIPLADKCLDMGAKVVMIKCGVQGIYYASAGRNDLRPICEKHNLSIDEWGKKSGFIKSFEPDVVISGTGAGEAAIAAFLTSMMQKKSLKNCVQLAAASGAMCVTGVDVLSGLIPLEDLQSKIDSGWKRQYVNTKITEDEEEKCLGSL